MLKSANAQLAPTDARPSIRDLIETAGRLITLMSEETDALRKLAFPRVNELVAEKTRLVERYAALARHFQKDPETLAAVTNAVREELREVLVSFDATARENEKMLITARDANEHVLRAIVEAAQVQRPRAQGYGRTGNAMGMPRSTGALSVAIDRQL